MSQSEEPERGLKRWGCWVVTHWVPQPLFHQIKQRTITIRTSYLTLRMILTMTIWCIFFNEMTFSQVLGFLLWFTRLRQYHHTWLLGPSYVTVMKNVLWKCKLVLVFVQIFVHWRSNLQTVTFFLYLKHKLSFCILLKLLYNSCG